MKFLPIIIFAVLSAPCAWALDVDADGMSDIFERKYGITDPTQDLDGDGKTNLAESSAGTHPQNGSEFFKAAYSAGSQPGFWRLTWPSVLGKNYGFRASSDLLPGGWVAVPNSIAAGTGGMLSLENNYVHAGSSLRTFYQVITRPSDDKDQDSLDQWEELILGTSESSLDDDGDLIPSTMEFIRQTNPLLATSPLDGSFYLTLGAEQDALEVFTAGD